MCLTQSGGWLVQEEKGGACENLRGDRQPPLLAARHPPRQAAADARVPDLAEAEVVQNLQERGGKRKKKKKKNAPKVSHIR